MQILGLLDVGLKLLEGAMFPILPRAVLPEAPEEAEQEQCLLEKNIAKVYVYVGFFESVGVLVAPSQPERRQFSP